MYQMRGNITLAPVLWLVIWHGSFEKQPLGWSIAMVSNDRTYIAIQDGDSRLTSNSPVHHFGDERRRSAGEDAPAHAKHSLQPVFEEEAGGEPGFDGIVGRSSALRTVLHDIKMVASTDSTVLRTHL